MTATDPMPQQIVCALYKFVTLTEPEQLRGPLLDLMLAEAVTGTLLLAEEGINGTICGTREGIDAVLRHLQSDTPVGLPRTREAQVPAQAVPFYRSKVKLKREIVTLGVPGIDPARQAGTRVTPRDWNRLISDPQVLLLDTRNEYEVSIGTFTGAVNPHTGSFRDFPDWADSHLDPARDRKIAMFCTGGIRCEKASSYLLSRGFESVYHLDGGILHYLEQTDPGDSLWQGECFVFDNRVSVDQQLQPGAYVQCHACRSPLADSATASPLYIEGVCCPNCHERHATGPTPRSADTDQP